MSKESEFMSLITDRFSVRKFEEKPVEQDVIDKILKAGHLAPTACNIQPQRILVINSKDSLSKLQECTKCHFNAPAAMLVCYDKNECWQRKYDDKLSGEIDAAIVTTHMMLEATALGIGSTWVMHFNPMEMRKQFEIPDNIEPVSLLVMGYPSDDAKPFPGHLEFKNIDEIVSYNEF